VALSRENRPMRQNGIIKERGIKEVMILEKTGSKFAGTGTSQGQVNNQIIRSGIGIVTP